MPPFFLVVSCGIGVTSSILPMLKPPLASALMAACAPGPGTREPTPPTALTLMWNFENPFDLADSTTALAAFIAANGDDSYLSAVTCMPPELIATVSAPVRSVMWIIVLL